jgi:hypothetical protein
LLDPSGLSEPVVREEPRAWLDRRIVTTAIPTMIATAMMKMIRTGVSMDTPYPYAVSSTRQMRQNGLPAGSA